MISARQLDVENENENRSISSESESSIVSHSISEEERQHDQFKGVNKKNK